MKDDDLIEGTASRPGRDARYRETIFVSARPIYEKDLGSNDRFDGIIQV